MTSVYSANFHVASDTLDWYVVTASMAPSEAPFAVLDFSLTGGTADGSYSIDISEGAPGSLKQLGTSGAAHAPKTSVSWATSTASSKTLYIQVRHVAGPPANDLYSLRLAMSGSQTVPVTVVPLSPQVTSTNAPSVPTPQSGTITPERRAQNLPTQNVPTQPPASGPPAAPPQPDSIPNTCIGASNMVLNLGPGQSSSVTGVIEAASALDWFTVRFNAGVSIHLTLGAAVTGGSEFQVRGYSACSTPLTAGTAGAGTKTLDFPDSGPHTVLIRISASPWDGARATYNVRLEAR